MLDRERAEAAIPQLETIINEAKKSADEAVAAVYTLNGKIKSIVQGAPTVDKAVSVMQTVLEAVAEYDPDYDTVDTYFWHDANGAQILGTAGNHILTVDWLGDIEMYLDHNGTSSTDATSGADKDLFNAIRALGWYSDVIV